MINKDNHYEVVEHILDVVGSQGDYYDTILELASSWKDNIELLDQKAEDGELHYVLKEALNDLDNASLIEYFEKYFDY